MQDSIERSLVVSTSIERVWQALSDHHEFGQWFGATIAEPFAPNAKVSCRSTYPGYEHLSWVMTIIAMHENKQFIFTWDAYYGDESDRDGTQDPPLTVTFELEKQDDDTLIMLKETGFSRLPENYGPIAKRINAGGWDQQMKNIASHVNG